MACCCIVYKSDEVNNTKVDGLTDIDEFNAVLLDGVQGDGDVLQGVRLALRSLVVFQFPLLKNLHQGNQSETENILDLCTGCWISEIFLNSRHKQLLYCCCQREIDIWRRGVGFTELKIFGLRSKSTH